MICPACGRTDCAHLTATDRDTARQHAIAGARRRLEQTIVARRIAEIDEREAREYLARLLHGEP